MRRSKRHTAREVDALAAAITWAREHGFNEERLPRGKRDSADFCPLARATGRIVTSSLYSSTTDVVTGYITWVELPRAVALFTELFDKGKYPELELK